MKPRETDLSRLLIVWLLHQAPIGSGSGCGPQAWKLKSQGVRRLPHELQNACHVLMTRFNVRSGRTANERALSSEWLSSRLRLFRDITMPSVVAQSRLPDHWLVFFDEDTPEETRRDVRRIEADFPLMRAEYCGEFNASVAAERIREIMVPGANWLLTTRLDNDDAVNRLFVESLQSAARPGVREFLNPTHGLIVANGRLYRKRDLSSPFITLSEPAAGFQTVWIDQHQRLSRHGPLRQFVLPDAWIQVIHGGNVANQVRGVRVSPSSVSPAVIPQALRASIAAPRMSEVLVDNSVGLLRRYAGSAWRRGRRTLADYKPRQ